MTDMFDYASACDYIERSACLGSRPGLERIRGLCEILGDPQEDLSYIHIAGTNGKGSTGAMIASALHACGLCVGMYYSPAVRGIKDHYMTDGQIISDDDYASVVSEVAAANEKLTDRTGEGATQFELETVVAFLYFKNKKCDAVVLETGMGGRDDATNIVTNKICCVLTSISFDHMQYLGDTLYDIATVKAGIVTSDHPVIMLGSEPEVTEAVRRRCNITGSALSIVDPGRITITHDLPSGEIISYDRFRDVHIPLTGGFQAENAAVALTTVEVIKERRSLPKANINDDDIRAGFAKVVWPFRFEKICDDPLIFVDGAHNADAAYRLCQTIKDRFADYTVILVMGMFRDKEYDKAVMILADTAYKIITVATPNNPRALPAQELANVAAKYCEDTVAADSILKAYDIAIKSCAKAGEKSVVIACGSFSYLAKFRSYVKEGKNGNRYGKG
ncbi:MAG: bifunctional folylpolyglutamate synthase/dihydrofolate synthase [Lachnospiraceae bacterium]|nr:bifunctional folylpolyglutamate synthase/dihydrofolate synthase [Lachnospiraceae bacterium]